MNINYIEDIKLIIYNYIENKYKKYLFDEKILIIENKNLKNYISNL